MAVIRQFHLLCGLIATITVAAPTWAVDPASAPSIISQPVGATVGEGIPVTLTVSASPFQGNNYRWYHATTLLNGATNSSFVLTNPAAIDTGDYYVVVSNALGTATSETARLMVVPAARWEHVGVVTTPKLPVNSNWRQFVTWVMADSQRLYIADSYVHIYDLSNPATPVLLSSYGTAQSHALAVTAVGNLLLAPEIAAGNLDIVDISTPTQPQRLGRVKATGYDVVVQGDYAYLAGQGFTIVNIADPAHPFVAGNYNAGEVYTLVVRGNFAYLAATSNGVRILDISDPASPKLVKELKEPWSDSVRLEGDRLYSAGVNLHVYNISDPSNPFPLAAPFRFGGVNGSNGMNVHNGFVYTGNSIANAPFLYSFNIYDVENPRAIVGLTRDRSGPAGSFVEAVEIEGDYIYAAWGNQVHIYRRLPATNAPVALHPIGRALSVAGSPARLEGEARGGEPLAWQWYHDGSKIDGETNRTLFLPSVAVADLGDYSLQASNSVGPITLSGSLALVEPPKLELNLDSYPRLKLTLPEGFQSRLEGSSNLANWSTVWSGKGSTGSVVFQDLFFNPLSETRTFRLKYGQTKF